MRLRSVSVLAGVFLLAAASSLGAQDAIAANPADDIAAQIEKARDLLREGGRGTEALNLLTPLLSRVLSVPDTRQRIELSAEIFLLRGIASAGLGDEASAFREFQSLYALGPDAARAAARNVFDPQILPLLKRAERESLGEAAGCFLAVVSDPPGAMVSINGKEIGETPVLFQAPSPGKVELDLFRPGYERIHEEIDIGPDGMRREFALAPNLFAIVVRSRPTGASIFLDGRETGKKTEAEITDLTAGAHRLRLELEGFRTWEGTVEATAEKPRVEIEPHLPAAVYESDGIWGGLENTLLKSPTAISRGPGRGFTVADASESRLRVFDADGTAMGGPDAAVMAEHGLSEISGLAVDRTGRFLISDPENHVVFLLKPDGRMSSRWGSYGPGPGEFNTPAGLALDEEDRVYIADSGNDRVQIRTMDGILLQTWGGPGSEQPLFQGPRSIAVRGEKVYVLDSRKVQVFSRDGRLETGWEPKGPEGESLPGASALVVDEEGCVFLADKTGQRILKYDADGERIGVWGGPGTEAGELGGACGLCLDDRGRVFVVEKDNHRIQIFRAGGKPPEGAHHE